jgi:hypothetical protein
MIRQLWTQSRPRSPYLDIIERNDRRDLQRSLVKEMVLPIDRGHI